MAVPSMTATSNNRKRTLFFNVEPMVREAFHRYAEQNDTSASSLGRKLIVKFLLEKGVISERMLIDYDE